MVKINKPAGFWIRFLTRILDLISFLAIVVGTAFVLLKKGQWTAYNNDTDKFSVDANTFHFESVGNYYGWLAISVAALLVLFILIPMLTNGRTLWMFLFRIKIDIKEDKTKPWIKRFFARFVPIFKREIFMSLTIGINLLLMMALFDKDTFNKFTYFSKKRLNSIDEKHRSEIFTSIDSLKIAIVTTFASILFVTQMVIALSIIVRKLKRGFHDSFSKTTTIWEKRFIELKDKKEDEVVTSFRPRLVKKPTIEWVD